MLTKFSIKKPLTVLVMVVIIMVLGVISFGRLTPDLYPNVDFPYVAVVTSYVGATPSEVEKDVTEPIEQQLAALENLERVDSFSGEGYSMVVLEFNQEADLSVISVDIRDKIGLVSSQFPEQVQDPTVLKMNPNMIPIMVAAVSKEDASTVEVSTLIEEELKRRLEGTDGVAKVSTAGEVENAVHIRLDEDKINALNAQINDIFQGKIDSAKGEVLNGIAVTNEGQAAVAEGKNSIVANQNALATGKQSIDTGLKSIRLLLIERTALEELGITIGIDEVNEQIQNIVVAMSPYESELKQFGIDLETATKDLPSINSTINAFNVAASIGESQLANGMAELTGQGAYLQAVNMQLQATLGQIDNQETPTMNLNQMLFMTNISQILKAQNFQMPAGYMAIDGKEQVVSVGKEIGSMEELKSLVVFDLNMEEMGPVTLEDIATVSYLQNGEDTYGKVNGEDGVFLTFTKQSDYATSTVTNNILDKFKELEKDYPGVSFASFSNQGEYIDIVIDSVLKNLLIGGVLAILILFFFLRDIRPTFITAVSIPISVIFAIVLMYFTGVTLNVISLAGLAVGIGMLVDNSIIVIENIYRLRSLGYSAIKSATQGAVQVSGAVLASTITTICVFFPLVFVEGITKQLFLDMALTIGYALIASLLIALTVVPTMGMGLLKGKPKASILDENSKMTQRYRRVLEGSLRHKWPVLLLTVVLLFASGGLLMTKGFEYMPGMAQKDISITLEYPTEISEEDCIAMTDEMIGKIKEIKEVDMVGAMLTEETNEVMGFDMGDNDFHKMSLWAVMNQSQIDQNPKVVKAISDIGEEYDVKMTVSGEMDIRAMMGGKDVQIEVYGDDLDAIETAVFAIEEQMGNIKGLTGISNLKEKTNPEIMITVDKNKAMSKGFTQAQVYQEIRKLATKTETATNIITGGQSMDVKIQGGAGSEMTIEELLNREITTTNPVTGETSSTLLKDIATAEEGETVNQIERKNQKRCISITAALEKGYNGTHMEETLKEEIGKLALPDDVNVVYKGENADVIESLRELAKMILLGILLIYLVMVAQFQSLLSPFIVMATVPLAFTGGILALLITGYEISVVSAIGFIMLMGVVVNNGIVLIDYINQLRREGMEKEEAIIKGGVTRIRPVMMTALTTILALTPLAFGWGAGAEMMQPVAIVCIGGLLYATLMTLIIIPIVYSMLHRRKIRVVKEEDLVIEE